MFPLEKMVWKFVNNPFREAGCIDDDCTALCRMVNEVIVVLIVEVYHEADVVALFFARIPRPILWRKATSTFPPFDKATIPT